MDKKIILPALAGFMILVMIATAFPAATAVVVAKKDPLNMPLSIVTIAEDDEVREKGIMILCVTHDITFGGDPNAPPNPDPHAYDPNTCKSETVQVGPGAPTGTTWNPWIDKWADYKILLLQANGAMFTWPQGQLSPTGLTIVCEVIEKDTVEPKVPQDTWEVLKKEVTDRSADFKCKERWKVVGGFFFSVGVLDVYYTATTQRSEDVAPYILNIQVTFTDPVTKLTYYGNEMQDLCILAWPFNDPNDWQKRPFNLQKPEKLDLTRVPDPLDGFVSCEDATLYQRALLGAYIPTAPGN